MTKKTQKEWLLSVKRVLSKTRPTVTWDDLAGLAGIEPRALKTYRMPEDSSGYRKMPPLAEAAIKALIERPIVAPAATTSTSASDHQTPMVVAALAALVLRLARVSLIDGRMISGTTRLYGDPVGLTPEDRQAMALISRACLINGLPDHGAEIHQLLWYCTQPLGQWLSIQEVRSAGLSTTTLIHAEEGIPTAEAEELAKGFSSLTAGLEEQLFTKFLELLSRHIPESADRYYTTVREFVVRHPVCRVEDLKTIGDELPSTLWTLMQQQFYEPVPESWQVGHAVPLCEHCGNALRQGKGGLQCRTNACVARYPAIVGAQASATNLLRVTRGIRQYWVEPGLDEVLLFDTLRQNGFAPELYPHRDRVDIALGKIGIDLKAYASPETLGQRFRRSIGGLTYYAHKWVVIPDWLPISTPMYLERLRSAMDRPDILCLTVNEATAKLLKEGGHA